MNRRHFTAILAILIFAAACGTASNGAIDTELSDTATETSADSDQAAAPDINLTSTDTALDSEDPSATESTDATPSPADTGDDTQWRTDTATADTTRDTDSVVVSPTDYESDTALHNATDTDTPSDTVWNNDTNDTASDGFDGETQDTSDTARPCTDLTLDSPAAPPTVLLLIDRSGSMDQFFLENTGEGTRWDVIRDALLNEETGFIKQLESEVRFGLALYAGQMALPNEGNCPNLEIVEPDINNYTSISSFYLGSEPMLNTPTADALLGVTQLLLNDIPDSKKIIVLVTDGLPDTCADPDAANPEAAQQAAVDAVAAAFDHGISTYVIAVSLEDTTGHFQALANAGLNATDAPYFEANDQDKVNAALEEVIFGARNNPCEFEQAEPVDDFDAAKCILRFQSVNTSESESFIFEDPNGWTLSTTDGKTTLELTGNACETVKTSSGELSASCPCRIVIPEIDK